MKSAYEIAMARMEEETGPTRSLTDEQKKRVAEIDSKYEARIAETRLGYDSKLATVEGPDQAALEAALSAEVRALEEKREGEKEAVWNE